MKYKYSILVVGCGGTGGYFLKEFSRYLFQNEGVLKKIHSLTMVDGDMVEAKNLTRQCFVPEDIGYGKAYALSGALNEAFSLSWEGYGKYLLSQKELESLLPCRSRAEKVIPVIIGCVDNHGCRLLLEKYFQNAESCIYFDSANEFSSGEVVFSVKKDGEVLSRLRSEYFPEVKTGDTRNVDEISCEELNNVAPQHIVANMLAGNVLLSGITSLLEQGAPPTGICLFDAKSMSMQYMGNR